MLTQLQEHKKQTKAAATIQQKSTESKSFNLQDNRAAAYATQLMAKPHGKACGCSSCSGSTQSIQRKVSNVTQLANSTAVVQLGTCSHCKWEGGSHKPGCTPETRAAAKAAKVQEGKKQHDKSMDDRTRADQSHQQHGGDAKGRAKMYAKRGK